MGMTSLTSVLARDTEPSSIEVRREEFLLKQRIKPALVDVLKEEYLGLVINIRYVLLHDPIVSKKSKISQLKLPGFGTRVTITSDPNDIAGYIDKYIRYRYVTIITKTKQPEVIEESVAKMIKESEDMDFGGRDTISYFVLSDEFKESPQGIEIVEQGKVDDEPEKIDPKEEQKEKVDKIIKNLDEDRKEKKERLAKLFPDLQQPSGPVDPRREAESSKHLILSKQAYYNNDLNAALNEVIEAININPYASKSYEMLGSIYYRLKWYNLAVNNWEKALALDPENTKLGRYIEKAKREL